MNNPDVTEQPKAPTPVACSGLLACPWCRSEHIMAEGTDKRMAMVCQNCLARGPEVNVEEGRGAAIHEWNKAIRQPPQPDRMKVRQANDDKVSASGDENRKLRKAQ